MMTRPTPRTHHPIPCLFAQLTYPFQLQRATARMTSSVFFARMQHLSAEVPVDAGEDRSSVVGLIAVDWQREGYAGR
jgi:hypothetical protein